ncbi:MAG: helix-turn-helix domain-containing protein [Actinomycetales bacterium]
MPDPFDSGPRLTLPAELVDDLRERLPQAAQSAVRAIVGEVPPYRAALSAGRRATRIVAAVQLALSGFIDTAAAGDDPARLRVVLEGAYALGRDEARSGRSMEALLAAYRVGARASWQELADVAARQAGPELVAGFAAMVFAYIDELSAASVAGHSDELTDAEVARRRRLERLTHRLLTAETVEDAVEAAQRAAWSPAGTLTAVLLPGAQLTGVRLRLDPATLVASDDTAEILADADSAIVLVPNANRTRLVRTLAASSAVVGPTRAWNRVNSSLSRALRARELAREELRRLAPARPDQAAKVAGARAVPLGSARSDEAGRARAAGLTATDIAPHAGTVLDTDAMLSRLVVCADREALADLQGVVLAPFAELRAGPRERLLQTLRSWLLHQGRREPVAADLFVHPQTVRYRMTQLRELLGERLDDPAWCEAAVLVLAAGPCRPLLPPGGDPD